MSLTEVFFGLVPSQYHHLITPVSLILLGLVIDYKAKNSTYVGRLTMFSNAVALTSFYITIPATPNWMILIINITLIFGVVGLLSYAGIFEFKLTTENYYKYTKIFSPSITGLLIGLYYLLPNLFV